MIKTILNKLFWGVFRHLLSDKQYGRFRYWLELDRWPDLNQPKRFTEKVQYIKLYQRTKLRSLVADRIKVRDYISMKIGEKYLIPLIGNFDEISEDVWQVLPTQFVLKANHGSKMVQVVKNKEKESFNEILNTTKSWQAIDYYKFGREWVYKRVPKTIVVEHLLRNENGEVPEDYKFFCFNGKVEVIQIDFDRFNNHSRNFYDRDFNLLSLKVGHPNKSGIVTKHPLLNKAIETAEKLSSDFDFIRVDLFLVNDQIFFGELTNYPNNGYTKFSSDEFDSKLGKMWQIDLQT